MKKLIMLLAVSAFAAGIVSPAFSQDVAAVETKDAGFFKSLTANKATSKGNYVVSGGFDAAYLGGNYYSAKEQDSKGANVNPWYLQLNPSAEYFVNNGLSFGGTFIYGYKSWGVDTMQHIAFGPKASFYLNSIKDTIPFISIDLLLDNNMIYKGADKSNHWDYSGYSGVLTFGALFMASEQVGFYLAANFSGLLRTQEAIAATGEAQTKMQLGWTGGVQFGVKYFIF